MLVKLGHLPKVRGEICKTKFESFTERKNKSQLEEQTLRIIGPSNGRVFMNLYYAGVFRSSKWRHFWGENWILRAWSIMVTFGVWQVQFDKSRFFLGVLCHIHIFHILLRGHPNIEATIMKARWKPQIWDRPTQMMWQNQKPNAETYVLNTHIRLCTYPIMRFLVGYETLDISYYKLGYETLDISYYEIFGGISNSGNILLRDFWLGYEYLWISYSEIFGWDMKLWIYPTISWDMKLWICPTMRFMLGYDTLDISYYEILVGIWNSGYILL